MNGFVLLTQDEMAERIVRDDGNIKLVAGTNRVAGAALIAAIEWYWYEPGTPRNDRFHCHGTEWQKQRWIVAIFPEGRMQAVRRLAKQLGLRIADGPPIVIGEGSIVFQVTSRPSRLTEFRSQGLKINPFPGSVLPNGTDNPLIFNVENDSGSPVFKNRKRDEEAMLQAGIEINTALNRGAKLTPAQIADYIYGSGEFPKQE